MPTIIRQDGFRVVIYPSDHAPPHVHVQKAGREAVIELNPVKVKVNRRMSLAQLRSAKSIVRLNVERLLAAWEEFHVGS